MTKEKRYNKFVKPLLRTKREDTLLKLFERCQRYDNAESVKFCCQSH